jgi:hypothetical protein
LEKIMDVSWNLTASTSYGTAHSKYDLAEYQLTTEPVADQTAWNWIVREKDDPNSVLSQGRSPSALTARTQALAAADNWDGLGRMRVSNQGWRMSRVLGRPSGGRLP